MNRILITFSGAAYDGTTQRLVEGGKKFGAHEVWVYDDRWLLTTPFGRSPEFQYLLTHKGVGNPNGGRGFGWFSWKPVVMADALSRCEPGDIVLFLDADTFPIADFSVLYEECSRIGGTMLFSAVGCNHARWCKRDCFIRMGMDEPRWRNVQHAVARFFLFQRGAAGVDRFLTQWQAFNLDPIATTFEPSQLAPEHPEFLEIIGGDTGQHRTEQAILTNLAHLYGHKLYREACQFGAHQPEDKELYQQLFVQEGGRGPQTLEGSRFFFVPGVNR